MARHLVLFFTRAQWPVARYSLQSTSPLILHSTLRIRLTPKTPQYPICSAKLRIPKYDPRNFHSAPENYYVASMRPCEIPASDPLSALLFLIPTPTPLSLTHLPGQSNVCFAADLRASSWLEPWFFLETIVQWEGQTIVHWLSRSPCFSSGTLVLDH